MYVLEKTGVDDRTCGPTRKIIIRNGIRQGGVLSVMQYVMLMDEISQCVTIDG